MYRAPVAVSILTNGERRHFLDRCVKTFLGYCDYRPLWVFVMDNGSTDSTPAWLSAFDPPGVEFSFERSEIDLGLAEGTNRALAMTRDFPYAVHVESDFEHLSPDESGVDKDWLVRAIDLMSSGECDYLYLRRMRDEVEAAMHWWDRWLPMVEEARGEFLKCPGFWWSNNPHLRNNEAVWGSGVLPLDVSKDGPKGSAAWTRSELEAGTFERAWLHMWGMFVHERRMDERFDAGGCGLFGPFGESGCKYGFWKDGRDKFCRVCWRDAGFTDMVNHRARVGKEDVMDEVPFKIATVDNGWAVDEFERLTSGFLNADRVVMRKGVSDLSSRTTARVVEYDKSLAEVLDADVVLFPKVGFPNREEFRSLVEEKVPIVVHVDHHCGLVVHEQNGWHYQDESWAIHWLREIEKMPRCNRGERSESGVQGPPVFSGPKDAPECVVRLPAPKLTFITPTWKREPKTVSRCLGSVRLQTIPEWEHLVCSDGDDEEVPRRLVESLNDGRTMYESLPGRRKDGDFGNRVRAAMLEYAKGEYVAFLDDDNVILPEYAKVMLVALDESRADFAVCQVLHFGPVNESVVGPPPVVLTGIPPELYRIDTLQVVCRTKLMRSVGWDQEAGYLADGKTFERLAEAGRYVEVPCVLGLHL